MLRLIAYLPEETREIIISEFPFTIGKGRATLEKTQFSLDSQDVDFSTLATIEKLGIDLSIKPVSSLAFFMNGNPVKESKSLPKKGQFEINNIQIDFEITGKESSSSFDSDPDALIAAISQLVGEDSSSDTQQSEADVLKVMEKLLQEESGDTHPPEISSDDSLNFLNELDSLIASVEQLSAPLPEKEKKIVKKETNPEPILSELEPLSELDLLLASVEFDEAPSMSSLEDDDGGFSFAQEEDDLEYLKIFIGEERSLFIATTSLESPQEMPLLETEENTKQEHPSYSYVELSDEEKLSFAGINFKVSSTPQKLAIKKQIRKKKNTDPFTQALIRFFVITVPSIGLAMGLVYTWIAKEQATEIRATKEFLADLGMSFIDLRDNTSTPLDGIVHTEQLINHLKDFLPENQWERSTAQAFSLNRDNFPYLLYFLHSKDFKSFLAIAVPKSHWTHKLVSQPVLTLHSDSYQLHADLRVQLWEGFLKRSDFLDKHVNYEIIDYLKQTPQTNLEDLSRESTYLGFKFPENMKKLMPGGQNLVYNAPRYYRYTQPFISQLKSTSTSEEFLKKRLIQLSNLKDLVIYINSDQNEALDTLYKTKIVDPSNLLYFATFNEKEGPSKIISNEELSYYIAQHQLKTIEELAIAQAEREKPKQLILPKIDGDLLLKEALASLEENKTAIIDLEQKLEMLKTSQEDSHEILKQKIALFEKIEAVKKAGYETIQNNIQLAYDRYRQTKNSDFSGSDFLKLLHFKELDGFASDSLKTELLSFEDQNILLTPVQIEDKVLSCPSLLILSNTLEDLEKQLAKPAFAYDLRRLQIENIAKEATFRKLKELLFDPQHKQADIYSLLEERSLLQKIFSMNFLNSEDQRRFFINEFDRLFGLYAKSFDPDKIDELKQLEVKIRSLLKEDKANLENELEANFNPKETASSIAKHEKDFEKKSNNVVSVPLEKELIAASLPEQQKNFGRLGLQILVQAKLMTEDNPIKETQIKQALSLLYEATPYDRSLWQPIIEGRLLLVSKVEEDIKALVNSDLGLKPSANPLYVKLRSGFFHYLERKKEISSINQPDVLELEYTLFKQKEKENLEQLAEEATMIASMARNLQAKLELYEILISDTLKDFSTSQENGFFAISPQEHNLMFSKMDLKLKKAKEFNLVMKDTLYPLQKTALRYKDLIDKELSLIASNNTAKSLKSVDPLFYEWKKLTFPILLQTNALSTVESIVGIKVDLSYE